jgi:hypothetical protein
MARGIGSIRGLCLALLHRWEPEALFVILTAYFDESGTHDSSETVVAGVMASALKWERFEKRYLRIRKKFGFKVFHTKHFKHRSKEFSGWSPDRCVGLIESMERLTNNAFTESTVLSVDNEKFQNEYRSGQPTKAPLDSAYGLCFRGCLEHLILHVAKLKKEGRARHGLYIVIEKGCRNEGDALRIYGQLKDETSGTNLDFLRGVTLASKEDCPPLFTPDFLAHMIFWRDERRRAGKSLGNWTPNEDEKRELSVLTHKPGTLAALRKDAIERFATRKKKSSSKAARGGRSS